MRMWDGNNVYDIAVFSEGIHQTISVLVC